MLAIGVPIALLCEKRPGPSSSRRYLSVPRCSGPGLSPGRVVKLVITSRRGAVLGRRLQTNGHALCRRGGNRGRGGSDRSAAGEKAVRHPCLDFGRGCPRFRQDGRSPLLWRPQLARRTDESGVGASCSGVFWEVERTSAGEVNGENGTRARTAVAAVVEV